MKQAFTSMVLAVADGRNLRRDTQWFFRFLRVILLGLVAASAGSCAKMGDPLPPVEQPPATIQTLRLVEVAQRVDVIFSLPAGTIEWVEIYRQCAPLTPESRLSLLTSVTFDDLTDAREPGFFVYRDRNAARNLPCRYALRFVDNKGRRSEFSNLAVAGSVNPNPES